jgi:hypothetical protein
MIVDRNELEPVFRAKEESLDRDVCMRETRRANSCHALVW